MQKVKTHWEARWKEQRDEYGAWDQRVKEFTDDIAEVTCKTFALQKTLELSRDGATQWNTRVSVVEVETHEEETIVYDANTVLNMFTSVKPDPVTPLVLIEEPEDTVVVRSVQTVPATPIDLDDESPF